MKRIKTFWEASRLAKELKGPNRRKILVSAGVGLVVLLVAFGAYRFVSGRQARFQTAGSYQTAMVEIGTLVETIAATGGVEAGQASILNWQTSGIVETVYVSEGEEVERGDVLAELQLNSVPASVIGAQSELLEAQQALEDFYASYEGVALAEAQKAVADAQDAYETALYTYNSLLSPADDLDIEDAYVDVMFAREKLDQALKEYERYANRARENENRARAVKALADAQSVYDVAARQYNALAGTAAETQLAVAAAELAVAQEIFNAAQGEYERLLAGPTEAEIAAAKAQVAAAEANLSQRLIVAPFDGVVTLVHPQVGDYIEAEEAAFELQKPATFFVQIQVNELDINQVRVGQPARVILDAVPDAVYEAEVAKVGSIGDSSSGVVTYTVVVEILEPDEQMKTGMTAVVEIETSTGKEALLIPNQAVRLEDGRQLVYLLGSDGSLIPVEVELGASSSTHSEMVTGSIQPGDRIVLNPPTDEPTGPGGFFLGGVRPGPVTGSSDGGPSFQSFP
ncbi:MAG: efflux RND transporter periplasmic adaptor subunit [Anaerolineales bacterium]